MPSQDATRPDQPPAATTAVSQSITLPSVSVTPRTASPARTNPVAAWAT